MCCCLWFWTAATVQGAKVPRSIRSLILSKHHLPSRVPTRRLSRTKTGGISLIQSPAPSLALADRAVFSLAVTCSRQLSSAPCTVLGARGLQGWIQALNNSRCCAWLYLRRRCRRGRLGYPPEFWTAKQAIPYFLPGICVTAFPKESHMLKCSSHELLILFMFRAGDYNAVRGGN